MRNSLILAVALISVTLFPSSAPAGGGTRVSFGFNFGGPAYYHAHPHYHAYYHPYPYYVVPAPVYYAPPPVVYVPRPGYYPAPYSTPEPYSQYGLPSTYSQSSQPNYANGNLTYNAESPYGAQSISRPPALLPQGGGQATYDPATPYSYDHGGSANSPAQYSPSGPPSGPPQPSR